ncbi:MAG: hypothetical protein ACM34L_03330, partial [Gemmatimonas sp.]|nr:hypothetical protein [Gemmatimonadaceae bacterium]
AKQTTERFRAIGANAKLKSTDDHIVDGRILDARMAMAAGNYSLAYSLVADVLRARGYFEGKRIANFRSALLLASEAALRMQQPDSALRFARDARRLATLDSIADSRSAHVGEARLAEGRALLAGGDTVEARATLERALAALSAGAGSGHPLTRETVSLLSALPH